MAKKTMSFEEKLIRLDQIAQTLEAGELPLEASLKLFEEGAGLLADCKAELGAAKQKITEWNTASTGGEEEDSDDTDD